MCAAFLDDTQWGRNSVMFHKPLKILCIMYGVNAIKRMSLKLCLKSLYIKALFYKS